MWHKVGRSHAPNPQYDLLLDPKLTVASVQRCGHPAVICSVLLRMPNPGRGAAIQKALCQARQQIQPTIGFPQQ
jgi:hypothetical protein